MFWRAAENALALKAETESLQAELARYKAAVEKISSVTFEDLAVDQQTDDYWVGVRAQSRWTLRAIDDALDSAETEQDQSDESVPLSTTELDQQTHPAETEVPQGSEGREICGNCDTPFDPKRVGYCCAEPRIMHWAATDSDQGEEP